VSRSGATGRQAAWEKTMQGWFVLVAAIAAEVAGTTCLKLSDGFSRLVPSLGVVVLYMLSFVFLAWVLKTIDLGVAYAIWAGLGTALVAAVGFLAFGEAISAVRLVSIGLIIVGVVGLQLSGAVH
jgi:small multidrug resistance pump